MWPAGTDISAGIGHISAGRAAGFDRLFAHFQNSAAFIEGVHHAADRGRRACLCATSPRPSRQAAVRFVVSFAALIGLSLLLAGL